MYFSQRFPPMKIFDPEFRNIEYSKPARITRSSVTFVIFKNLPYMFKVLVLYGHGATSVTATEKVPINYHIENKVLIYYLLLVWNLFVSLVLFPPFYQNL